MRPESYIKLWYFENSFRSAVKTLSCQFCYAYFLYLNNVNEKCEKKNGKNHWFNEIHWNSDSEILFYQEFILLFCDPHSHMTHHHKYSSNFFATLEFDADSDLTISNVMKSL